MAPGGGLGGSVKNVGDVVAGTRWGARDAGSTISRIGLPVADGNETPSSLATVGAGSPVASHNDFCCAMFIARTAFMMSCDVLMGVDVTT